MGEAKGTSSHLPYISHPLFPLGLNYGTLYHEHLFYPSLYLPIVYKAVSTLEKPQKRIQSHSNGLLFVCADSPSLSLPSHGVTKSSQLVTWSRSRSPTDTTDSLLTPPMGGSQAPKTSRLPCSQEPLHMYAGDKNSII